MDELPYNTLKGTRKIHQITIHNSLKSHELAIRNYACLFESCAQQNMDSSACDNFQIIQEYGQRNVVNLLSKAADEDSDDEMCDELQDAKVVAISALYMNLKNSTNLNFFVELYYQKHYVSGK